MKEMKATSIAVDERLSPARETMAAYYELTKPGITLMVVISTAAGFYLALPKSFLTLEYALLFLLTVAGTALVSAGSCVLNHVMEHEYDRGMKRTALRARLYASLEHAAIA